MKELRIDKLVISALPCALYPPPYPECTPFLLPMAEQTSPSVNPVIV